MSKYKVGVVGIGLVGSEMVKVLRQRNFPASEIRIFATRERTEEINGEKFKIEVAGEGSFKGLDVVLFAGTEGSKGASKLHGWKAVEEGAFVIDNGDDFRMDPRVPLVVPEVNPHHLSKDKKFIANPNCSTIQMVVALAPLHKKFKIRRVVVSTYQSVSGTGRAGLQELYEQAKEVVPNYPDIAKMSQKPVAYPHRIAFNLIPQISGLSDDPAYSGYYKEEIKMIKETRKILDEPEMKVTATCVRVPVFWAHSETVNIEFDSKISAASVRDVLSKAPGIVVLDNPGESVYPMPVEIGGKDEVFVGRIRQDVSNPNAVDLWVVSDNIRKGAALNAVQIAETLIARNLLKS
ncbi:MAG: aspartate-semialdehyde dehydrogenase [Elusimicrobia bacterium RIFOXYA2_FULL_39_19]|nr:MAG: aspartate-semialdehyde dehydrogenase [Elusimicrobia bacterium RIFOXYA2_FULL_39_19]